MFCDITEFTESSQAWRYGYRLAPRLIRADINAIAAIAHAME